MSPIPSHTNGNIQNPQAMTLSEAQPVAVRWFLSVYSGHWVTAGTHAGLLSLLFPRHVPPACRPPLPPSGRPRAQVLRAGLETTPLPLRLSGLGPGLGCHPWATSVCSLPSHRC